MQRRWSLLALILLISSCSEDLSLTFRIAEDEPGTGLTEISFKETGESFYFYDEVVLNQAHVDTAWVVPTDRGAAVELRLTEEGTQQFADLTTKHVGKRCGMFVDGELVTAPIIRAPIPHGRALLTGDFAEDEANRIATELSRNE